MKTAGEKITVQIRKCTENPQRSPLVKYLPFTKVPRNPMVRRRDSPSNEPRVVRQTTRGLRRQTSPNTFCFVNADIRQQSATSATSKTNLPHQQKMEFGAIMRASMGGQRQVGCLKGDSPARMYYPAREKTWQSISVQATTFPSPRTLVFQIIHSRRSTPAATSNQCFIYGEPQYSPMSQFLFDFLAGGTSGAIAKTVTAPIERVKLIMQTMRENEQIKAKYKGFFDCLFRCAKEEGFLSLWRGNGVNVVRYFPTQALNFSFKDLIGRWIDVKKHKDNHGKFLMLNILSGGLASFFAVIFVYPLDFARTRLGVDMGRSAAERQFSGLKDCLTKTVASDGLKGLYRGFWVSAIGLFIYRGLYFGLYDFGTITVLPESPSLLTKFFFAQAVVVFSETVSYPGDTIKRKLMMQSAKKQKQYSGAIDCIKKVWAAEGIRGFMHGTYSNIIRSIGSSLCLVLYDSFKVSAKGQ